MEKDKKVIIVGLLLVLGVAVFTFVRPRISQKKEVSQNSNPTIQKDSEDYMFISADELRKQASGVVIFDSRSSDDFQTEHLIRSTNVSPENIEQFLPQIPAEQKIVIVGSNFSDLSVKMIAKKLKEKGRENFAILSGGFEAWIKSAGRTVRQGNPDSLEDQAKITLIKSEDLKSVLEEKNNKLFILDLRSPSQFAAGHIPQAQNIPAANLEAKYQNIPPGKTIVYYAGSGIETFRGGVTLFDLGLVRSSALEGGFEDWKSRGFPVEK